MLVQFPQAPATPAHTLSDNCRSPRPALGCPPGRPPAPSTPKDSRSGRRPPGSCLLGVPTETTSPSPERAGSRTRSRRGFPHSLERSPRLLSAPPWCHDSPRTTRPHCHQWVHRSSRRNQVHTVSSPQSVHLKSTSRPALPGPGLSPRARAHLCRGRSPRSPRRHPCRRPGVPPSYVPEVPGVGGAGAESRPLLFARFK